MKFSFMFSKIVVFSILFFFLAAAGTLTAQTIGVKAGMNMMSMKMIWYNGLNFKDQEFKAGANLGVTAEFPLKDHLSLETGLIISQKGMKFKHEQIYQTFTSHEELEFSMLYIDIPLTAKGSIQLDNLKFYGLFGPYLGIGHSGEIYFQSDVAGSESDITTSIWGDKNSNYDRLEVGWIIGAGYQFKKLEIGVQYDLGLSNIVKEDESEAVMKNRVFEICFRYKVYSTERLEIRDKLSSKGRFFNDF